MLPINPGIHARTVAFVSAVLLACVTQATAQSSGMSCMQDMQRLCSKVVPGQGRKVACLRAHVSQLTPACRDQLKSMPSRAAPQQAKPAQKPGQ